MKHEVGNPSNRTEEPKSRKCKPNICDHLRLYKKDDVINSSQYGAIQEEENPYSVHTKMIYIYTIEINGLNKKKRATLGSANIKKSFEFENFKI